MRDWQKTQLQETGMVDIEGITVIDLVSSLMDLGFRSDQVIVDGRLTAEPQKRSLVIAEIEQRYPEHEKMVKVKEQAEAIGDFLTLYVREGLALCEQHAHDDGCYDETGHTFCGLRNGSWTPVHRPVEDTLADYFEIDLNKINAEKDAMLAAMRSDRKQS